MAHTPGPWQQSHRQTANGMYSTQVYDAAGETIATLAWHAVATPTGTATDRDDNARLIAAAPDLLAACQRVAAQDFVTFSGDAEPGVQQVFVMLNSFIVQARAAVAKATGTPAGWTHAETSAPDDPTQQPAPRTAPATYKSETRSYRVSWEIDIEADSHHEAAHKALAIQRREDSTATVFDVKDSSDEHAPTVRIDLDPE